MMVETRLQSVVGVLWAGLLALGPVAGCSKTPRAIRDLQELPPEFSKDLALARTAPVLMTKPSAAPAAPPQPRDKGTIFAIARACTTYYAGYVLYPMTVCYPPSDLFDTLAFAAVDAPAPRSGVKAEAPPPRYFKLTSPPQANLRGRWFCTVRSGPWYGKVEGAQQCSVDPNVRVFHAQIEGAPETVVVDWTGALTDVPPPLALPGIQPTTETCVCCSGVTCPDGSCAPDDQHCGPQPR